MQNMIKLDGLEMYAFIFFIFIICVISILSIIGWINESNKLSKINKKFDKTIYIYKKFLKSDETNYSDIFCEYEQNYMKQNGGKH